MRCAPFSLIHETLVASLRALESEHCPPDQPRVPDVAVGHTSLHDRVQPVAPTYCSRNQTQRQDV